MSGELPYIGVGDAIKQYCFSCKCAITFFRLLARMEIPTIWLVLFIYYLGVYPSNGTQTTIWVCISNLFIVKLTYESKRTRKMMFNNCHLYSSIFVYYVIANTLST